MKAGRAPLVIANWKMNKTAREAASFVNQLLERRFAISPGVAVAVVPAFPALERVGRLLRLSRFDLGAQDVFSEARGAFTGEVSAAMLKDLGVELALVGHSERRRIRSENEADFARKIERLREVQIAPVYCVGETGAERSAGETERVLERQLRALDPFGGEAPLGLAVAYEPVWSIGTGTPADPDTAAAAHRLIRGMLSERFGAVASEGIRILYGGSVTPEGVSELARQDDIDGALVGGASLNAEDFARIAALVGEASGPT